MSNLKIRTCQCIDRGKVVVNFYILNGCMTPNFTFFATVSMFYQDSYIKTMKSCVHLDTVCDCKRHCFQGVINLGPLGE